MYKNTECPLMDGIDFVCALSNTDFPKVQVKPCKPIPVVNAYGRCLWVVVFIHLLMKCKMSPIQDTTRFFLACFSWCFRKSAIDFQIFNIILQHQYNPENLGEKILWTMKMLSPDVITGANVCMSHGQKLRCTLVWHCYKHSQKI